LPEDVAGQRDVHLDGALELRAVGDLDARGAEVADHAGALAEGDALGGDDVTLDLAVDLDAVGLDVGGDQRGTGDEEVRRQGDATLHPALHLDIFLADEGAPDGDPWTDDTGSFVDGGSSHGLYAGEE
jgi:hypothetical protein